MHFEQRCDWGESHMADMFARVDQPVPGRDPTAFDKETLGEKNEVYAFMSARRN